MPNKNRRQFLCESFSAAAGFSIAGAFSSLSTRMASAAYEPPKTARLVEAIDESTGLPLLHLPPGFRYRSFGWTGDLMDDGSPTPNCHDGMAVVADRGGVVTLIRNHEIGMSDSVIAVDTESFDSKVGGGCTTLTFDTVHGEWRDSWGSLSGTVRNCAGGVTQRGTWLSCEETVISPGDVYDDQLWEIDTDHGWVFEVPSYGSAKPVPLKAMGRFVHEAVAVDRKTGIIYQTEDMKRAGFYRFLPNNADDLVKGGRLQMMKVIGFDDLTGGVPRGKTFDTTWVDIEDPERAHHVLDDKDAAGVFTQGTQQGGTAFARLEGCWFGDGKVFFDATSGGAAEVGQIWQYDPESETLTMLFESPAAEVLNMPDNLCCSPQGGLIICEDSDYGKFSQQRIHYLSERGELTPFALNTMQLDGQKNGFKGDFRGREWAGATFSPDGNWLFVNIQTPGVTFAITGPWDSLMGEPANLTRAR